MERNFKRRIKERVANFKYNTKTRDLDRLHNIELYKFIFEIVKYNLSIDILSSIHNNPANRNPYAMNIAYAMNQIPYTP